MPKRFCYSAGSLAVLILGACTGSHPSTADKPRPPSASAQVDPARAAKADVILVVRDSNDEGGSKFHTWTAKLVEVVKAPPEAKFPTDLHFAMYGWEPEVPAEPTIVYFVYFDSVAKKGMRALGWQGLAPSIADSTTAKRSF